MRLKIFAAFLLLVLSAAAAQAQDSLEAFCGALEADDTISVSPDFTSEELQAQLFVTAGLNSLQVSPEVAIGMFDEAINVAEGYADAYLGRGCAYVLQGNMGSAQADLQQFVQLTDDTSLAGTISGLLGQTTGGTFGDECSMVVRNPPPFATPAEAQSFIDTGGSDPKSLDFAERAEAFLCVGDIDAALDDFGQAIASQPDTLDYLTSRGIVYRRMGEYELAIADFDAALEIDPNDVDALDGRAYSFYLNGDYDQCIVDYDRSIELYDQDYISFGNRGLCYDGLGDFETAIENYNLALELEPNNAIVIGNRAVAYRLLEQYDLALEDNNRAIEIDPSDPFYFVERGLVHYELEEFQLAVADFTAAIELDPTYSDAWLNMGDAQRQLKDSAGAVESYQRYLELYPDSPYAQELQDFIDAQ